VLVGIKNNKKEKLHSDRGTRTHKVCFRRELPSRILSLGYIGCEKQPPLPTYFCCKKVKKTHASRN